MWKIFSLAMTATIATTGTLSELGLNEIEDLDDLQEGADELKTGVKSYTDADGSVKFFIETAGIKKEQ